MISKDTRGNIESMLGRALYDQDLRPALSLDELPEDQAAIARVLASKQLVLCAIYLRAVVSSSSLGDVSLWMDKVRTRPPPFAPSNADEWTALLQGSGLRSPDLYWSLQDAAGCISDKIL